MKFTVDDEAGRPVSFECPDGLASRWTCGAILEGRTYPHLPFVPDVETVVDVGANCGAFTVHAARLHPSARVHAIEPGSEARSYLERNVRELPNVVVHPHGLHRDDREATLYVDGDDLGQASVFAPPDGSAKSEVIDLRSAAGWAQEQGIRRIDVLKVDVEGCELDVLAGLAAFLPEVKVLYIEYESRSMRREIDRVLEETHELYLGALLFLDQGECLYLRKDLADHEAATPRLRELFARNAG